MSHPEHMFEAWSNDELARFGAPIPKHRRESIVPHYRRRKVRNHQMLGTTTYHEPEDKALPAPDPGLGDPRFPTPHWVMPLHYVT